MVEPVICALEYLKIIRGPGVHKTLSRAFLRVIHCSYLSSDSFHKLAIFQFSLCARNGTRSGYVGCRRQRLEPPQSAMDYPIQAAMHSMMLTAESVGMTRLSLNLAFSRRASR